MSGTSCGRHDPVAKLVPNGPPTTFRSASSRRCRSLGQSTYRRNSRSGCKRIANQFRQPLPTVRRRSKRVRHSRVTRSRPVDTHDRRTVRGSTRPLLWRLLGCPPEAAWNLGTARITMSMQQQTIPVLISCDGGFPLGSAFAAHHWLGCSSTLRVSWHPSISWLQAG